jgi:hypothetical protein
MSREKKKQNFNSINCGNRLIMIIYQNYREKKPNEKQELLSSYICMFTIIVFFLLSFCLLFISCAVFVIDNSEIFVGRRRLYISNINNYVLIYIFVFFCMNQNKLLGHFWLICHILTTGNISIKMFRP